MIDDKQFCLTLSSLLTVLVYKKNHKCELQFAKLEQHIVGVCPVIKMHSRIFRAYVHRFMHAGYILFHVTDILYCSVLGKRLYTTFQGVSVPASIQTYGSYPG